MLDTAPVTDYIPDPTGCGRSTGDPMPSGSRIGRRWFVAATISGQEHRALFELRGQQFEAYLPLHIEPDRSRIVPLFRGYLFVSFDPNLDQWRRICSTRGVWSLIWRSPEVPAPVPIGCVEDLIARTSERRIVDDPGLNAPTTTRIPLGANCEVLEGPLTGWRGVCSLSTEKRVRLLLAMFGGDR